MADGAIVDVHNIRAAGERLVEMLADSASSTPLQLQTQVGSKPWTVAGIAAVFKCRVVPFVENRQSAQGHAGRNSSALHAEALLRVSNAVGGAAARHCAGAGPRAVRLGATAAAATNQRTAGGIFRAGRASNYAAG